MKKLFAFIPVFLVLSAAFADVSVKKLDADNVEVTFFYGNPRASEVRIAGDFTSWESGALPMEKTETGFTLTKTFAKGSVLKYKFISDGNWTADLKAPDFVDDGFGGKNGVVDVDALVSGGEMAAEGGAAPAASKAGLKFLTWSMLGLQVKGNTHGAKGIDSVGIGAKSYMKAAGNALPNVPVYFEVAVAENDDFENLYKKNTLKADKGFQNFFTDLFFDPFYWLGGQKPSTPDNAVGATGWTYLGHFKFGIESQYVNWTTGYKYAKLPSHKINGWTTVDQEWEAGYSAVGGYNYFELGSALQQIGPVQIKAAVAPNRTADRAGNQYGLFSWVSLSAGPAANFDLQYNGAYGKTFDKIFNEIYETDIIFGYKGSFGPVTATLNFLHSEFGEEKINNGKNKKAYTPSSSDVGETKAKADFIDGSALNVQAKFANDMLSASLGYRFRGIQANMMYVEQGADDHNNISDQLGKLNRQKIFAKTNFNITEGVKFGIDPAMEMVLIKKLGSAGFENKDNIDISVKPHFDIDFEPLAGLKSTVDGYAKFNYETAKEDAFLRGAPVDSKGKTIDKNFSQFLFKEFGVKYEQKIENGTVDGFSVIYDLNNGEKEVLFNSLLGELNLSSGYNLQLGFGLRMPHNAIEKKDYNRFGCFAGANKKLSVIGKPKAYLQFMFGMDPYKSFGDGPADYKLDDYKLDRDVKDYESNYAFRLGLHWDF